MALLAKNDQLTLSKIEEIVTYCREHTVDHPTAYYAIAQICRSLSAEYEGGAIPMGRFVEMNNLIPLLRNALENPGDIAAIDALVMRVNK